MSSYRQSYAGALAVGPNETPVDPSFLEEYPTLGQAFQGVQGDGNGTPGVSQATINLFWEGGVFKFCIMPKLGNRVAFGVIKDPCKGLAALEAALCQGQFEWKISKSRK